ncbi:MAG TPA: hypothetical protein V6D00_12730 [Pantanalinema sp.]
MRPFRPALLLLTLCVMACQTEIYPEAPTLAARPTPNASPVVEPGGADQTAGTEGGRYLEFVAATNKSSVFYAFYPLDEAQATVPSATRMTGTVRIAEGSGAGKTLTLRTKPVPDPEPFLYAFPDPQPKVGSTYAIHVEITAGGHAYVADYTYVHRAK